MVTFSGEEAQLYVHTYTRQDTFQFSQRFLSVLTFWLHYWIDRIKPTAQWETKGCSFAGGLSSVFHVSTNENVQSSVKVANCALLMYSIL